MQSLIRIPAIYNAILHSSLNPAIRSQSVPIPSEQLVEGYKELERGLHGFTQRNTTNSYSNPEIPSQSMHQTAGEYKTRADTIGRSVELDIRIRLEFISVLPRQSLAMMISQAQRHFSCKCRNPQPTCNPATIGGEEKEQKDVRN